jgi:glycosyltransferase involved in cell wall biosynthesis
MQPSVVRWIDALARHAAVAHVTVVTLRAGEHHLPPHVEVRVIGHDWRLGRLARFYVESVRAWWRGTDCFFVHQGGHYPLLLLPFRLLLGKPVYQWKAHPHVSRVMRLHARFCDTKLFTSTRNAFPVDLPNIRVVGQGVDTERFRIVPGPKRERWITVGRISPVKRLDEMLVALALCNRRFGTRQGLDLYGPTPAADLLHRQGLERLIRTEGLEGLVAFHPPVRQDRLPGILNAHPIFLHFCDGALDRTVVEAMACGLPVLSTNPCVGEIVPEDLRADLILPDDVNARAVAMHAALQWDAARRTQIGARLRAVVVARHGVTRLFDEIVGEMTHEDVDPKLDHPAERTDCSATAR